MLLLKFDLDEIFTCQTTNDVFELMGIGLTPDSEKDLNVNNKEVFGEKAYYRNMIMSDYTFNRIKEHLKRMGKEIPSQWPNYAPVHDGFRFKTVEDRLGEINDSVLYIITPDDDLYEKNPTAVTESKKDEQGSSNS